MRKYDFHTQAEMIRESCKDQEIIDSEFETVCNRIIETFKSDKKFVENFQKDKEEFLKYRLMQVDTILPEGCCFSNYPIYSNSYIQELTQEKVVEYRRAVELYCRYNYASNDKIYSEKAIKKIFK